jgi:hypothetical protein
MHVTHGFLSVVLWLLSARKHYLSFDSGFRPYGHWSQVGHSEGPTNHLLVKKTWARDCEECWSCQVV